MFDGIKCANKKSIPNDIISGIIIALVTIPISMGYAQIAGLPAVYGLYCSVVPVFAFALLSSSPQYIFGVDAAPCAMVGAVLASMGIAAGSEEAMSAVPVITFFTAVWLLLFSIFKAGRLTQYVSNPVMGGFISGICTTIIFMQLPKLFGASAGSGEIVHLLAHIAEQIKVNFNIYSLIIGLLCIALILTGKKLAPKFPVSVVVMLGSALLQYFTNFTQKLGINTLEKVERGLGAFAVPDFSVMSVTKGLSVSLTIAVVIMAETLLAENNFAARNGYKIKDNNEVVAFGVCNFLASAVGGCPVNGSLSRTSMNEQFSGKSQLTSLVASVTMVVILLFCTDFIAYLPVPVLTAIVICALLGAIEFELAKKLYRINKKEFFIFLAAFFGVLVFGTVYGVVIGVLLSFVHVVLRESDPPRTFLGVVEGRGGFFDMKTNPNARQVRNVVIYRFNANLFFANVKAFRDDIEASIQPETKCIIVDAGGIVSIDTTGADVLESLYKSLKEQEIKFYLTEHMHSVNDQLRSLGLGYIIEEGAVRRTISAALRAEHISKPYPLENGDGQRNGDASTNFKEQLLHEFEWAFGDEAQAHIDAYTQDILDNASRDNLDDDSLLSLANLWEGLGSFDEDILLESLELRLSELSQKTGVNQDELGSILEQRREKIYQYIKNEDEQTFNELRTHRHKKMRLLRERSPELYKTLHNYHEEVVQKRKQLEQRHKEKTEIKK